MIPQILSCLDNPLYTFIALMLFSLKVVLSDRRRLGWALLPSNFLMLTASGLFLYDWPRHGFSLKWSDSFVLMSAITFGLAYGMRRWEKDTLRYLDEDETEEPATAIRFEQGSFKPPISIVTSGDSIDEPVANRDLGTTLEPRISWTIISDSHDKPDSDSMPVSNAPTPRRRAFGAH